MMKKYIKGCIGTFIFVLLFMVYVVPVYAAGITSIKSYICPNTEDLSTYSADNCAISLQDGDYDSLTEITSSDTVPEFYDQDNGKKTIIIVEAQLDTNNVSNVSNYNVSYQYDISKLQLIYADRDLTQFPVTKDRKGRITAYNWNVGVVYGNLGGAEVYGSGQEAPENSEVQPGIIKVTAGTQTAGEYLLPTDDAPGPYSIYLAFEVKDDAKGESSIKFYDAYPKKQWDQLATYNSGTIGDADIIADVESTFTIGSSVEVPAAITKLEVYDNSSKSKLYPFGIPGSTYPATYNSDTHSYDLYLPAGTSSIYIHSEYSDGASVSGDIGTKVLSAGTASFVITGTIDGEPSVYTITYHVPNNKLTGDYVNYVPNGLKSDGTWVNPKVFSPTTTNYSIYLTPAQAASVSVSATVADANGGIETKFKGTTKTAKTQTTTVNETLTNVQSGDTYQVISYGADCFGDYATAMGSCEGTTYTITYKVIDRTFSSISIVGVEDNTTYGVNSFNPATKSYTVYVPASVTSVKYGAIPTDSTSTGAIEISSSENSKALNYGNNTITLVGETNTGDESDTYTETYTITVYRLSDDASIPVENFTSSQGTLSQNGTDSVSGNVTTREYDLHVASSTTSTNFTITPTDSKAYLDNNTSDHGGSKSWTISTTDPYTVSVKSESCNPTYASIPNIVCKQTNITVNATQLSSDTSIAGVEVRDSETGSTTYPVTLTSGTDDDYTVTVPSTASSVFVTVTPTNPAIQNVSGNGTVSGLGSAGSNKLHTVTVTAEDPTVTKNYKITIHKAGTDASLKSFTMTDGTNPVGKWNKTFTSTDNAYSATVEDTYTSVSMSAEATSSLAKLNGTTSTNTYKITDDSFNLDTNPKTYTVTVYAESCMVTGDTCVQRAYTLEVTKKSPISKLNKITVKSSDGNTTYGSVTPVDGTNNYKIAVPAGVTDAQIEVEKGESNETISGDGAISGLSTGSNVKTVTSTSDYGSEHETAYSLDVYVLTDNTDITITSSKGSLTVDSEDDSKYTLKINDTEANTSITATAHTTAFIDTEATGNTKTATWTFTNNDPDTYTVKVFPERCKTEYNGGTACTDADAKVYTITRSTISTSTKPGKIKVVNPSNPDEVYGEIDFTGTPAPTAPYKISIPADVTNVKLVVDKGDEGQTVNGEGEFNINVGTNNKPISITSEAGGTPETYTINIYRPSSDMDLTALTFSKGELDPAFDKDTKTYTLKISETETSVNANATASTNSYINNESNGNALTNDTWTFAGNNTYTLKVFPEKCKTEYNGGTACTDSDANIYTVSLQQLNNEKNITKIEVNGKEATPDGTDKYKVYLKPSDTTATFTCTASDNATCEGDDLTSLNDGTNNGTVRVTAEDGTHKDVTVEVYRVSNKTEISALTFTEGALKETIADGTYTYTGKFSDTKTTTNLTYTAKYNGFIDEENTNENGTVTSTWSLANPVNPYTFTVKSESCKSTYSDDIKAECATQLFTINYESIDSAATLDTISVKDQNGTEYFTGSPAATSNTVYVPASVTQYTVSATAENTSATVNITPNQPVTSVVDGDNPTVTITVTPPAESGASAVSYTVVVHRLSDSADLTSLTSSVGTLKPTFASGTYNYDLEFPDDTAALTYISATANNNNAKLTINGDTNNKVTHQISNQPWNLTNDTYTILVESEACEYTATVAGTTCTSHTYTITKKVLSGDTILTGLSVTSLDESTTYSLDPAFSNTETQYKVDLPSGTTTAAIIIDPGTSGITISSQSINTGGTVAKDSSNQNKINASGLVTGDNKVTINLLAQNGVGTGSYEVTLHVKNTAKTLGLTTSVGTLTPQTGGWKLTIPNGSSATSTTFTATIPNGATIKMNGTDKTTTPYTDDWTFSDGGEYVIVVTPEEGDPQTYTVVCEIQGPELSDDNSLTGLTADNGNITAVDATNYKLEVPYGTTSSNLTATIPSGAKINMGGNDITTSPYTAEWSSYSDGDTYDIVVTSEKGTPKTYTVTVKIGEPSTPSSSTLHSITVKKTGADETYTVYNPTFAPDSNTPKDYTVYVPYTTTNVDVSAVATDSNVTPVLSESNNVLLAEGDNNITIAVTSATNSSDTTTYTLNVYRLCNNTDLGNLQVSTGALNETFNAATNSYTIFINNSYPSATVTATLPENHTHGYINSEENTSTTFTWNFNNGENDEFTVTVYSESCKAAYASVEGNANQCNPKTYTIKASFFSDKITSDTFGLKLETFEGLDIIADARVDSLASDLKGEQTDNPSEYLVLYRADGVSVVPDGEIVATGMILRLIINGTTYDERTLVVPGDTNGDGVIDIFDLLPIVDHILDTVPLTGPYLRAADYNNADGVDIFDLLPIVDYILGQ